jgi:AcrR family transcriptional regulator
METIAAKVGVSATALYRHYAGKYDLFRGAVLALSQQLVDCTDLEPDEADPAGTLDRVVDALIDATLDNRDSGGLYRWQARYLRAEDQATLTGQLRLVNRRIQQPLMVIRPSLISSQRWMLSAGVLSVIGSIVDHRVRLPADEIRALLAGAASAILAAELPEPGDVFPRSVSWRIFAEDAGVYEALLQASMVLFKSRGYSETSMAHIASAAGIPVSGIYRYFSGKCEILATGLRRAADRASGQLSPVLGALTEPRQALTLLIDAHVATSVRQSRTGRGLPHRAGQPDARRPNAVAQCAAVDDRFVGAVADGCAPVAHADAGGVPGARRYGAGGRPGPDGQLRG